MTALLLWVGLALAGPVSEGAAALEEGRLDDAIAAWSQVAEDGGAPSGRVSYNLGTAWYRKGDWPRAVAHLRAAARLRPRDGAVQHNLALARAELGSVPPATSLPAAWMSVLTPGELGGIGLIFTALGSLLVVIGRSDPRLTRRLLGLAVMIGGFVLGGIAVAGGRAQIAHPLAVVVDGEAVLRDSASVNAAERFRLDPGAEVAIEKRYSGFLLVRDGHGRRGWVSSSAVEVPW
ncbi:MAG: tetratricopeptide repeat protein [Myxococcales bacterium]|nr:tetratricopeptide repeat protein [Myxococcales bacterium]